MTDQHNAETIPDAANPAAQVFEVEPDGGVLKTAHGEHPWEVEPNGAVTNPGAAEAAAALAANAEPVTTTMVPRATVAPLVAAVVHDTTMTTTSSAAPAVVEPGETTADELAAPAVVEPGETTASEPAPSAPTPAKPGPKPSAIKPSAIRPSNLKPAAKATRPAAPVTTVAPVDESAAIAAASAFGRVADDGTVFVIEAAGERPVGQVPGQTGAEAMTIYVRRYLDLAGKVDLFDTRLANADLAAKEIDTTIEKLREESAHPAAVGDLDGLRSRIDTLVERAEAKRAERDAQRAAAKAEALAQRTMLVEAAERLANADRSTNWRIAGDELHKLLEQWKTAQRSGTRIDRHSEDALWRRFSTARTAFEHGRRKYFAELDQRNAASKSAKEALVAEAEKLATSTDWGATASAYRDLMTKWKAAGRGSRKDDDALWIRFRGAQDKFFAAREAVNSATDAEFEANLKVKEELLAEAEAILPVKHLNVAKAKLRALQDKWEAAGKVPRAAMAKTEARMRAVEQAVRDAEQAQWVRTNPETRARAEGAAAQLGAAIAALGADITKAQLAGNTKKVAELEEALAARKAWLEQVLAAAEDSRA